MKNNTLLLIGGVVVVGLILYEASKKKVIPQAGVGLAATTSPQGSASGILTPVNILQGTGGLLKGIEAFLSPAAYGSDVTAQVAANVQTNVQNSGIETTGDTTYNVGLLDPSLASDPSAYGTLDTSAETQALYES